MENQVYVTKLHTQVFNPEKSKKFRKINWLEKVFTVLMQLETINFNN